MTKWERFKHELFLLRHDFYDWLGSMKRKIWNKSIKLWWHRLFIRKDEFHSSLNMDAEAIMEMSREERNDYHEDLARRRQIAHERDIAREDAGRKK